MFILVFAKSNINLQMLTRASSCKEVLEKGLIAQEAMLVLVLVGADGTIILEFEQLTVYYVAKQQFHQNQCRAALNLQQIGVKI